MPKKLDVKDLFGLAVLCEKYECHGLVRPWSEQYNPFFTPFDDCDRWLYITWALGFQRVFTDVAGRVVKRAVLSVNGEVSMGNQSFGRSPMPEKIIGLSASLSTWYFELIVSRAYLRSAGRDNPATP